MASSDEEFKAINFDETPIDQEDPKSFCHLLSILIKTDNKKLLGSTNPDGFFYLEYIKICIQMFTVIIMFGGAFIYVFYRSN